MRELLRKAEELLYAFSIRDKKKRPRLVLQYEDSKDYLIKLIEGEEYKGDLTNSIRRMQEAYTAISDSIKKMDPETLSDFTAYLMVNVEMVVIEPDNISSALKIFETINQRGVGLNAMDLLKNLIFRQADESDFQIVKETWQKLTRQLEKCGEGDKPLRFLRYLMMARYYNGILREDEIYRWVISKEGKDAIKYDERPVEFVKELLQCADKYSEYVNATVSGEEKPEYPSMTRIGHIGRASFRQHLILLLAISDKLGIEGIELLCKQLEILILYYVVTREPIRDFERKFSNWAKDLRGIQTTDELRKFINNKFLPEINERENRFKQAFLELSQWDLSPLYRTKYILGRIEDYIRENCNLPRNSLKYYQTLELEHSLPQTPDPDSLREALAISQFSSDREYREYVSRLGNLTLAEVVINRVIRLVNKISQENWFDGKLNEYKKSDVLLTASIAGVEKIGKNTALNMFVENNLQRFNKWDKQSIEVRQQLLYNLAKHIWKISV